MIINLDTISVEELMANGGRLLAVAVLQSLPYQHYLKTNHWKNVRDMVWKRSRGNCERLGCTGRVRDIHHLKYDNVGMEDHEDVEGLCENHHDEFHQNWEYTVRREGQKQFGGEPQ